MKQTYQRLKNELAVLEAQIKTCFIDAINHSEIESKHCNTKCIKVNVFDYDEMVILDGRLTFLDKFGQQYCLYLECTNDDLIELLFQLNLEESN